MDGRRILVAFGIAFAILWGAVATGENGDFEVGVSGPKTAALKIGPEESFAPELEAEVTCWASSTLPANVRLKLESGFELAAARLRELPACSELFTQLGCDGKKALTETLYYPAPLKQELRMCRNVLAFTMPDGRPTWLCRQFSGLSDERAATVILHEALHHSGMQESHEDQQLLSPREIDRLVSTRCQL